MTSQPSSCTDPCTTPILITTAPFALVLVMLTFVRGIAIRAIKVLGMAQLAICEVITLLTLYVFRPFDSPFSNFNTLILKLLQFQTRRGT